MPVNGDDPATVYPPPRTNRSTLGASLIASGQSGADNFMASCWYDYRRLHALTGDAHFLAVSEFLSAATAQVVNWDGGLGYKYRGLMNEAVSLSVPRGHGVRKWLPWLTVAVLRPLVQEQEAEAEEEASASARIRIRPGSVVI